MGRLADEIAGLRQDAARARTSRRWLWLSLALDVALTAILGFGFARVQDAQASATSASHGIAARCVVGNKYRADELRLWQATIDGLPSLTASQRAELLRIATEENTPTPCSA
jgi:hypothetical protein